MTNGEKFKEVFGVSQVDEGELYAYVWLPNHDAAEISIDWWNAEYQEPTTKNDLGVDLISRADVLKLMQDNWHTHNGDWAMQESMDDIRALPSVTPQEPQTFKWCTDCKEYDQEKHCCHRWSKVIRDTVEEMKQEPRWIPVSERLPEENMDVLVVVEFPDGKDGTLQRIEIASFGSMYHLSSEKGWITNNFTRITRTEVKAWMPLPERYKAESEDKK